MRKVILHSGVKDILRISLLVGMLLLSIIWLWEAPALACGFLAPTTVDLVGSIDYPSIATDSNNKVFVSYRDTTNGNLKYANNTSGAWVNGSSYAGGYYTSIAIDSNNKVHISYANHNKYGSLNYATNASGSWANHRLNNLYGYDYYNKYTSIAIDSNNKVHISFYDGILDRLMYTTNASGSWATYMVDSGLGLNRGFTDEPGTSIAIDSNNKVHISYLKLNSVDCLTQVCIGLPYTACKNNVKYATNKDGYWAAETVFSYYGDIDYVYRPSLALDSNNKAHIAFSYCDICYDLLYYATNASGGGPGGNWAVAGPLPPSTGQYDRSTYPGLFPSIALDSNNKVHIMHSEWSYGRLWYTTNASGSWVAYEADDDSGYVKDTSVAIDTSNKVHTAYKQWNELYDDYLLYAPCPNMPDLGIPSIGNPPASANRGSSFSVTDTTRNSAPPCGSGSTAGTSITRYRLSLDAIITNTDPLLTGSRSVPSLGGGLSSAGTVTVTIPASLPVGTYYLGACADDTYMVSEVKESNNCRASATTIQVR